MSLTFIFHRKCKNSSFCRIDKIIKRKIALRLRIKLVFLQKEKWLCKKKEL